MIIFLFLEDDDISKTSPKEKCKVKIQLVGEYQANANEIVAESTNCECEETSGDAEYKNDERKSGFLFNGESTAKGNANGDEKNVQHVVNANEITNGVCSGGQFVTTSSSGGQFVTTSTSGEQRQCRNACADDQLVRETAKVDSMNSAESGFDSNEFSGTSTERSSRENSNQFANAADKNIDISRASSEKDSSEKPVLAKSISERDLMQKSTPVIVMDHKSTSSNETANDPSINSESSGKTAFDTSKTPMPYDLSAMCDEIVIDVLRS